MLKKHLTFMRLLNCELNLPNERKNRYYATSFYIEFKRNEEMYQ